MLASPSSPTETKVRRRRRRAVGTLGILRTEENESVDDNDKKAEENEWSLARQAHRRLKNRQGRREKEKRFQYRKRRWIKEDELQVKRQKPGHGCGLFSGSEKKVPRDWGGVTVTTDTVDDHELAWGVSVEI
ncbi:hypothetical protein BDP81DRAFT_44660 [Colletotrichum phormii]|uniref:Uncharacterized protein n=1 Tax=Colletotrichum phormii TaxID=359342 RepID=A0AAI9ZNR3_9PEZI|nr:uncharacterized protein BDP81DRAFT_44660 [Colletotrichum phormii]KAK1635055.1 hypothetical protein BDP81DRAFT_44660 [Colletotrichum phormii]